MSTLKYYDGSTWVETNGKIVGDTLPVGSIIPYGSYNVPSGWLPCSGQEVSKTEYAELFAAIGTSFGYCSDSTKFKLPNLNNYSVPVGYNTNDSGHSFIGDIGGERTHTLTVNEMPSHNHQLPGDNGSGSDYTLTYQPGKNRVYATAIYSENKGGGQAHNNMPPYVAVNYIIKVSQTAGLIGEVVNSHSYSTSDTYSCDYINGIIENGSNDNGSWTKYADGTMICTLNISVTNQAINTGYGSLYIGNRLWTFPQTFVDTPSVSCGLFHWGSSASWGSTYSPTVNQVYLRGFDVLSRATGTTCRIQAIAIGKWK